MRDMRVLFRPALVLIPVLAIGMLFMLRSQASSPSESICYRSVRIEEGDTLNSIYTRYREDSGITRSEFISYVVDVNDLQDQDHIHYDMYLLIPVTIR